VLPQPTHLPSPRLLARHELVTQHFGKVCWLGTTVLLSNISVAGSALPPLTISFQFITVNDSRGATNL